jgi:SAM-dependent methyltransferase
MDEQYRTVNRLGWDQLARDGCDSSIPYGPPQLAKAESWLDGHSWLPWDRFTSVLCLAAGGGQQGPLFAQLGYDVTVVDLSGEQLRRDRESAERYGLRIQCHQGDMLDLSFLAGRRFDLVYQPVSSLYVPDITRCYQEVAHVLTPGGLYYTEHWNPVQMQLPAARHWDGEAYRIVHRPGGASRSWPADGGADRPTCWHYIHSLDDLIGGLCRAGFVVVRFAERSLVDTAASPGSQAHLAGYLPTFFSVLARLDRSGQSGLIA